jgi:hypothetical protein
MRFSQLLKTPILAGAFILSLFFSATAFAAVGVTSSELQEAGGIVIPDGDTLGELPGYSSFSLQGISNISGGIVADYEARLSSDPWWDDELPQVKLMVAAYSNQDAAQTAFDGILNAGYFSGDRELLWRDDRSLLYESDVSRSTDIFGLVEAEFFSLHMIHVNGNLLYQASLFRENGNFNQDNLETYVSLENEDELIEVMLEELIGDVKLAMGILFPPTGTELSTKSEKSSLNLSELYSVPQHGTISFDLYIGEIDGAVGTILDSSGISEAVEGDLYLYLSNDMKLYAGIYAPNLDADCTQQSGWYRINTEEQAYSYEWNEIEFHYGVGGFSIGLNGNSDATCSVSQRRSENDFYFGDYPGDSIEESMIGYVNNLSLDYSLTYSGLTWDEVLAGQLFLDLPNTDLNLDAFQFLQEAGIFTGSDGMLYPDNDLNRAEMLKVLLKAYAYDAIEGGYIPFWDVGDDAWYLKYLAKAYAIGMVEGNPDGSFAPSSYLNRAEFFMMLYRVADPGKVYYEDHYTDVDEDDWFADAAAFAAQEGLLYGSAFEPGKVVTRREAAVVLYTLLQ